LGKKEKENLIFFLLMGFDGDRWELMRIIGDFWRLNGNLKKNLK